MYATDGPTLKRMSASRFAFAANRVVDDVPRETDVIAWFEDPGGKNVAVTGTPPVTPCIARAKMPVVPGGVTLA